MQVITQSCVLFLWMHLLTFVETEDCTLQQFLSGELYDSNFDTSRLEASYPNGKQLRINCNIGYTGFFKLICNDGTWTHRGHKCQLRSCGHPGDAQFADFYLVKGDDFVFGSEVVYTCHKGYQMISWNNVRHCMAEGWSGVVPVCEVSGTAAPVRETEPVETTAPPTTHSSRPDDSTTNGRHDGKKCGPIPRIPNGRMFSELQEYIHGTNVPITCADGYTAQISHMTCWNGKWLSEVITHGQICQLLSCDPPPVHENITVRGLPENEGAILPDHFLTFSCDHPGTHLNGSSRLICGRDGRWDHEFPTCEGTLGCGSPPHVRDGDIMGTRRLEYRHGDKVQYMCQNFYTMEGGPFKKCHDGEWVGPIRCIQPCTVNKQLMQRHNIRFRYSSNDKLYILHNDRITFSCISGTTHDGVLDMSQYCKEGVVHLPTCH